MYTISSHSSAHYSELNGTTYESEEDAVAALQALTGTEIATYDAGEELIVYASEDDLDADTDNRLAIARVAKA